ncbi:PRE_C2HC domain-containing protein [Trichonephila clavipes]|nr:PRE_C2HC domain-containing protein [Trichonephila clavipes]
MATNQDLTNVMELSLPSSNESTRPGTPTESNCERLIAIKNDIEKFSIVVENTKAGLKPLLFAVIPENDSTILDHNRRLEEYQRLQQLVAHKVVIKGLPRDTDTTDIHKDLIDAGFTVLKVTQLIGKITKQKLPVFLISLPRNIHNAKIFDLKKLSYLSINVEGYDNKGVTQCYSCNKFNHTADNCRLTPRCLKCGESHQTRECQIQHIEQAFCINCQAFGHMANYAKCPLYPKQKKVSPTNTKSNYTSIVNSLVRPNISYAQATNNNTSNPQQQMAPPVKAIPATKTQTQANRVSTPQQVNPSQNSNAALITQTLKGIIQALTTLTAQISNMNFNNNTPPKY